MTPQQAGRAVLRAIILGALAFTATLTHAALPPRVEQILNAANVRTADVAVWAQPVDGTQPSLSHQADRAMNPASVMKVVTAFIAFERFGSTRTWNTRLAYSGTMRDGVLDGNLYVIGSGDPLLTYERLLTALRQVRSFGVDAIRGDIILDASVLQLPAHDPGAFDNRPLRPYNAGPYGLLVNFNTQSLTLVPAARAGQPVRALASPPLQGLRLDNRITTGQGACGTWFSRLDARLEGDTLVLLGTLPASCGQRDWGVAPLGNAAFARGAVGSAWQEVGGTLIGGVRSGSAPGGLTPLLNTTSPTLAEIVRDMNKWSSNVIARQLLALVGADQSRALDMVRHGGDVAWQLLGTAGVPTEGFILDNGAGLSRSERIRADALGRLLVTAWHRPYMPEFVAALPRAGLEGTAQRRLADSPARGQAYIKTGTINDVRAIAGYVTDRTGRRHAVVVMINSANARGAQRVFDAVLEWLWAAES